MTIYRSKRGGQALIELALIIPFLLFVIANVVNYGGMFYAAITVANAARHGAQDFVYGSATVKNAAPATPAEVWALIQNETFSLPNAAGSLSIRICRENRDTPTAPACTTFGPDIYTFTSPAVDVRDEGDEFLNGWVDVGYTYVPYIPLFDVPVIGMNLTPPAQAMTRQSMMRVLH